jgi:hypothetical protein
MHYVDPKRCSTLGLSQHQGPRLHHRRGGERRIVSTITVYRRLDLAFSVTHARP